MANICTDLLPPDLSAVTIHSLQNLCRHSTVVMVTVRRSKQIGHLSSGYKDWKYQQRHTPYFGVSANLGRNCDVCAGLDHTLCLSVDFIV